MNDSLPGLIAAFGAGSFLSLLSVVNPPSTLPIYLGITGGMDTYESRRMARRACLYCFNIMLVSLFVGGFALQAFGVSHGALRVAGGLAVTILGHSLMYEKKDANRKDPAPRPEGDPTFFPLSMPGITGPGTIATVIGISTEIRELATWGGKAAAYGATIAAMAGVMFVQWLLMRSAPRVSSRIGPMGIEVMTRLSGFVLICVGVQFIASGVRTLAAG